MTSARRRFFPDRIRADTRKRREECLISDFMQDRAGRTRRSRRGSSRMTLDRRASGWSISSAATALFPPSANPAGNSAAEYRKVPEDRGLLRPSCAVVISPLGLVIIPGRSSSRARYARRVSRSSEREREREMAGREREGERVGIASEEIYVPRARRPGYSRTTLAENPPLRPPTRSSGASWDREREREGGVRGRWDGSPSPSPPPPLAGWGRKSAACVAFFLN